MDFRDSLKTWMQETGLTKKETAIRAGLNERGLDAYLKAVPSDPTVAVLQKLAALWECSLDKAYDHDFDDSKLGLNERTIKYAKALDSLNEHNYAICMSILERTIEIYTAVNSSEKIIVEQISPEHREPLESKNNKKNTRLKIG